VEPQLIDMVDSCLDFSHLDSELPSVAQFVLGQEHDPFVFLKKVPISLGSLVL